MQVTYELTAQDEWQAYRYWRIHIRKFWFPYVMTTLWIIAFLPFIFIQPSGLVSKPLIIPFIFGPLAMVALRDYLAHRRAIQKLPSLKENDNPDSHSAVLQITQDDIFYHDGLIQKRLPWKALTKIKQDRNYIYMYNKTTIVAIVPKRCFSDPREAVEFVNLAKTFHQRATPWYWRIR